MRRINTIEIRTWSAKGQEEIHIIDVQNSIEKKRRYHGDPVLLDFMCLIEKLGMAKRKSKGRMSAPRWKLMKQEWAPRGDG
jgi:hypothetical protein